MITFSNKMPFHQLLATSVLLTAVAAAYGSENMAAGIEEVIESADITTEPLPEVSLDLPVIPLADAVTTVAVREGTLRILGVNVFPGTSERLTWSATELFEGVPVTTPVLVVNGAEPGPTLCVAAAVHGDELNGIEIVRRVIHDLDEQNLNGAVIGIPIVNVQAFRRGSRYLPDRRDLNRYFPGNPNGSAAARIAHSFFTHVMPHCDALIDVHTGSLSRSNLPQIRADLRNPEVVTLTQGFASMVVLHSPASPGMLRYAATAAGIPTVTLEAGGPHVLELNEVKRGVKGVESLLTSLGMVPKLRLFGDPEPVYYSSSWVRSNNGGILLSNVSLGSTIRKGDLLGTITDPMNNVQVELLSPYSGRIIGMSRNQVVMPGDAAFHVGIQADDASTVEPTEPFEGEDSEEAVADESRLSE